MRRRLGLERGTHNKCLWICSCLIVLYLFNFFFLSDQYLLSSSKNWKGVHKDGKNLFRNNTNFNVDENEIDGEVLDYDSAPPLSSSLIDFPIGGLHSQVKFMKTYFILLIFPSYFFSIHSSYL